MLTSGQACKLSLSFIDILNVFYINKNIMKVNFSQTSSEAELQSLTKQMFNFFKIEFPQVWQDRNNQACRWICTKIACVCE